MPLENTLERPYQVVGNQRKVVKDLTFGTKYSEGGESVTLSELGLNVLDTVDCAVVGIGEGTVNIANAIYNEETEKVELYDETPGEVADEAEVKKPVVRITAYGY